MGSIDEFELEGDQPKVSGKSHRHVPTAWVMRRLHNRTGALRRRVGRIVRIIGFVLFGTLSLSLIFAESPKDVFFVPESIYKSYRVLMSMIGQQPSPAGTDEKSAEQREVQEVQGRESKEYVSPYRSSR